MGCWREGTVAGEGETKDDEVEFGEEDCPASEKDGLDEDMGEEEWRT